MPRKPVVKNAEVTTVSQEELLQEEGFILPQVDPDVILLAACVAQLKDVTGGNYDDKNFDHLAPKFIKQALKLFTLLKAELSSLQEETTNVPQVSPEDTLGDSNYELAT